MEFELIVTEYEEGYEEAIHGGRLNGISANPDAKVNTYLRSKAS